MQEKNEDGPPTEREVTGRVTHLFYSAERFSAGCLERSDMDAPVEIKFSGRMYLKRNDRVTLRGEWVRNPKYGPQFEASSFEYLRRNSTVRA